MYFTNVCEAHCAFCHFRRDEGEEGAYTLTPEEMFEFIDNHYHPGMRSSISQEGIILMYLSNTM